MNKTELVEAIASNTNMTKTDVDKVINSFIEVVTDALVKNEKVSLKGFGILKLEKEEKEQDVIQELEKR